MQFIPISKLAKLVILALGAFCAAHFDGARASAQSSPAGATREPSVPKR